MNEEIKLLNPRQAELAAPSIQTAQVRQPQWYDNDGPRYVETVEAFKPRAYKDSKGIPTIGHGFIVNPTTGKKVKMGETISREASTRALKANMMKFDKAMSEKYKNWREILDHNDKIAAFSLMHNQTNNYDSIDQFPIFSGIMSMEVLDEGQMNDFYSKFRNEILHWGDKKNPELIPRRRSEVWLMDTGEMKDQGWFNKSEKAEK
jgi:GH24 family phage-related lysozyme (muramidase)